MTHSPAISIIVACRNERQHIESCLESILRQEGLPGEFEVIVADGLSDDGTTQILQQLAKYEQRLRIVDNSARIVSTGLNAALKLARGEIIIRMDAHTEYAPDYIRQSLDVLQETDADNVGGAARTKSSGIMQTAICAAYHSAFAVGGARFHNVDYEGYVDTVPYGCWPRNVFDRIGLFDEDLARNQDDEFNLRLRRDGGKIWQSPRIKSWYRPRESLKGLFLQYMQYGYWKVRVIQKHKIPASVRHIIPGAFVLSLLGLPFLSVLGVPLALWTWIGILSAYIFCALTASIVIVTRNRCISLLILPLVFACYHFAYGVGFLRGVLDFLIFRRKPAATYFRLSRNLGN